LVGGTQGITPGRGDCERDVGYSQIHAASTPQIAILRHADDSWTTVTDAIVWFRRDLRLADNPALHAALRSQARVTCVYIHAPVEEAPWQPGAASRWWLHHSLEVLDASLRQRGSALILLNGPSVRALQGLIHATGARAVYWNRLYEPAATARDAAVDLALREDGIDTHTFNASLLIEPVQIQTSQGEPYRVFTPFWRKLRAQFAPLPTVGAPVRMTAPRVAGSVELAALGLLPKVAWDIGFHARWSPGEAGARRLLQRLRERVLSDYPRDRDRPDVDGTSRLSPHLHFGEIGPRQIAWRLQETVREAAQPARTGAESLLRELGWREFSQHLLHHFPRTPENSLHSQFAAFPWAADDPEALRRWQHGTTGVPIVDAGMRQLWTTGWMHNRVRMIVASFLTKNLLQHWRHGARWFWDTLVDADLANNTQGWQWSAGCGADAAPYFRIFNPVTQGQRFDPAGEYVRQWVPELADVAPALIHQPWQSAALLQQTGYPAPMVDLPQSRLAALAAYQHMRKTRT
jgi:deoxyribodipyrimidine photo-lyase